MTGRTGAPAEVTLGEHTLPVYAQRHAYLQNRLGRFIDRLVDEGVEAGNVLDIVQSSAYELLVVLIPNLDKRVPEWEFKGYGSREAMDAGEYDEQTDRSPTVPEIRTAFEVAAKVNSFDVLKAVWKVVDPQLLRGLVTEQIAEAISPTSPTLPSENGASTSTPSTTTGPTSTPSED